MTRLRDWIRVEAWWFAACFNTPRVYYVIRWLLPRDGDTP